jgi:hypothetical protein
MVREPIILGPAHMRELTRRMRSSTVSVRDRQRAQSDGATSWQPRTLPIAGRPSAARQA